MVLEGALPSDNESWQIFYEAESNLVRTLTAFSKPTIFRIFCSRISDYFAMSWEERSEKDRVLVERIFVLLQYVFAIGVESGIGPSALVPTVDAVVNERAVSGFFESGMPGLFIDLMRNPMDREFFPYMMSILSLVLKRFVGKFSTDRASLS